MKKHFLLTGLLLLSLSGCRDNFLDTVPFNQVDEGGFWKTATDATQGVNAIYNALQSNESFGMFMFNDVISPLATNAGYGNNSPSYNFVNPNANSQNQMAAERWRGYYRGIYRANLALEKIPDIAIPEATKQRLLGEAKFLRALNYFYLVNFFGDVPLITTVLTLDEAENPQVARAPVAQVRAQLYKDLDEAYAALPSTYAAGDRGRATKWAAASLKGRALLYENKFAEAATTLRDVITNSPHQLYQVGPQAYFDLFDYRFEGNTEVIFDVQYSNVIGTGLGNQFEKYTGNREATASGWSWLHPTLNLVDLYQMKDGKSFRDSPLFNPAQPYANRDPRMDFTIIRPGAVFKEKIFSLQTNNTSAAYIRYDQRTNPRRSGFITRKALCEDNSGANLDGPTNLILIRFADVLLMYAEAQNEVSGPDASVYSAINRVRQRASVGMPVIEPGLAQATMRETIRRERAVELALEGHYHFDMKRWDLLTKTDLKVSRPNSDTDYVNRTVVQSDRVFSPHYVRLPIPQAERDKNPLLTQNPGY
jgi:hypothetical protein